MTNNVVPFGASLTSEKSSPSALQLYQRIIRDWSKALNSFELVLSLHIADRTIGWQKTRATFSTVRMHEGDKVYAGLNMSRATMFRSLASLEQKGVIARHPHPEGKEIKVYSINPGWIPDLFRGANPLSNQSQYETTQSQYETTPVSEGDTRERSQGERNPDNENYTPRLAARGPIQPVEVIREKMGAATAAHCVAADRRAAGKGTDAIETRWRLALSDAFPEQAHCPWSMRDKGLIKAKMKSWLHANQIGFADFVDWSVRNWSAIVRKQLRWMKKSPPPKVPTLGFFVSFIDHFAEAWGGGKLDNWMVAPERTKAERLKRQGLSSEEAAAVIGKERAVVAMREENERAKIEVRVRQRQVQIAEQRVARMEATRIPDPRSRVALGINVDKPLSNTVPELQFIPLDPNWEPPEIQSQPSIGPTSKRWRRTRCQSSR